MALINMGIWGVIGLILAVLVIIDIVQNQKKMSTLAKVLWIIGSFVIAIIVPIIYYFVVKK